MISGSVNSFGMRRLGAFALTVVMLAAAMAVLGVGAVALNTRTAAGAGGGGCIATGAPVCAFKNHVAGAGFGSLSADGCTLTKASVTAFESLASPGHIATTDAFVEVARFDVCTNTVLESATNFDRGTGNPVFNGTIQFGQRLDSAAINGSAPMFDDFTGAQVFISTVNLTWRGFGPTSTFIDGFHVRMPGFLLNAHSMGASREAVVSGVVTDDTGTNLAALPTPSASLEDDQSGTVQLSHS